MISNNQTIYRQLMREVKFRTEFIGKLGDRPDFAIYNWTWIESICLQIRMILENIALACLVANGDQLHKLPKKLEKEYHAEVILKRLANINPDCYPQPVILLPGPKSNINIATDLPTEQYRGKLIDRPGNDWLTRDEFKMIYGRIGQVLHARNPLEGNGDFEYFNKMAPQWHDKIMNLLSHHKVIVQDDNLMYIVVLQAVGEAEGRTSGDVQVVEFQRILKAC